MFTFAFRPWLKKRLLLKLSIKEFKKRRRQKRRQRHKSIISLGMVLVVEAHSFPRASLSENCSLLGTDNVRGQISEHVFAPNEGYCLFSINLLVVYRESVNLTGYLTRILSADSLQL